MNWIFKSVAAGIIALGLNVSAASAAVIESCGNKDFSATQDGMDLSVTDPGSICGNLGGPQGNSTGAASPIAAAGWISGAEVQGSNPDGASGQGDGNLSLAISILDNTWTILNPNNYEKVGLSVKHGNGFAFYNLDLTKALTGTWFTYDNANSGAGNAFSHINAWYMGDPVSPVPLPAAGWMLIAGLGGLGAMRRFRKS
ncbi:VPLPA-CTERM sorting domain-containing protein [uncultured Roseobacter sp.]|uniref:VPLPA-CTERM sorting domain-containing protein n=1 Tax=uncultured Roseobacter sp. TaxID=114847 RepID=UPI00260567DF|nr:VPLPA-CTERM sorting domain-containing protein [uncultured Roseobacter sp.]